MTEYEKKILIEIGLRVSALQAILVCSLGEDRMNELRKVFQKPSSLKPEILAEIEKILNIQDPAEVIDLFSKKTD